MSEKSFLLVQLGDIGDLVLTMPAMVALRERYTEANITLLINNQVVQVVEGLNLVDEIIMIDRGDRNASNAIFHPTNLRKLWSLRRRPFDAVVFFHHFTLRLGTLKFGLIRWMSRAKRSIGLGNGNGWFLTDRLQDEGFGGKHQAQYWLDLVGLLGGDTTPRSALIATVTPQFSEGVLKGGENRKIIIHAGSGGYSLARRWSPQNFAMVADTLIEKHNTEIILVGTKDDDGADVQSFMRNAAIDMTGKTTLPELAGLIQTADLFIGADSGVMHIASAVGIPIIAIFGPSNHEAWSPWTPDGKSIVVRSAPECSPCSYVGHEIGLRDGCPARTCMRMIAPHEVIQTVEKFLAAGDFEPIKTNLPHQLSPHQRIHILDLPVDAITYTEWMEVVDRWIQTGERCHHVCTTNPEFMMIARDDVHFRNILKRADLCIPDGVGLLWAAKRQGTLLPERVTGSDGIFVIAEHAAQKGWRLFLLGAASGIAEETAKKLMTQFPGLQIAGTHAGSPAPEEEDRIVQMVNGSNADILLVAYGAPVQDKWIARNMPRLQVKMAMGVGGAFDFVVGAVPRAPMWMRRRGIEWLYRLYKQPWRIRRMMRLPRFVLAVLVRKNQPPLNQVDSVS